MFPILAVLLFIAFIWFLTRDSEPSHWDTPHTEAKSAANMLADELARVYGE